jgi:hypothetical protein
MSLMKDVTGRAITLVLATCVLAIAVFAAAAQAELVTPHAASTHLITPQAAPAPTPEPVVEEPAGEEGAAPSPAAAAPAVPAPTAAQASPLQAHAQSPANPSEDRPTGQPQPRPEPKRPPPLIEFGEQLLGGFVCPFFHSVVREQMAAEAARYTRLATIGILVGFDGAAASEEALQQANDTFRAVFESHMTQGFIRSCLTTVVP